jgi:hypothetical protein
MRRNPGDTPQKMTVLQKFYLIFVPERHFCGVSRGAGVPGERDSREDGEEYSSAKTNMSNIIEAELKGSILEYCTVNAEWSTQLTF